MSLISYKHDQDSVILRVKILDSSVTTGAGLTGLTSASAGLIISTIADNEATATAYTVTGSTIETITTLGTYAAPTATKCRFKELDATNHPGVYEIQLADARFAVASSKSLLVSISGATNAAQADALVPLTQMDPYDATRGGMTALPNAAADAAGGLPISDAGGLDLDAKLANTNEVTAARMAALTDWIDGGRLDLIIDAILLDTGTTGVVVAASGMDGVTLPSGIITAASIATDALGALELAADAAQEIADQVLLRAVSNVEGTADKHSLGAMVMICTNSSISDTTLTAKKPSDDTTFNTYTLVTTSGASPVTGVS